MLAVLTCDAPVAPEVRLPLAVHVVGAGLVLAANVSRCMLNKREQWPCVLTTFTQMPHLQVWRGMFKRGAINSFNQITVDGDTSTNDTVIGLASGLAGGAGGWTCSGWVPLEGAWCGPGQVSWLLPSGRPQPPHLSFFSRQWLPITHFPPPLLCSDQRPRLARGPEAGGGGHRVTAGGHLCW